MSESFELPPGWIQAPLGNCGSWYGGGTPSKFNVSYWDKGTIPWVSPKDMKTFRITDSEDHLAQIAIDETNVKPFPVGTVLVVIRSGILSRTLPVAVSQVVGTMNQDLKGILPTSGIESDFVAYFLRAFEQDVLRKCSKHGTTVASIDTASLHSYPLRIAPLGEQKRIVAKIEELFSDLDAGVAALKRAKANLKRYRAAVLKAAVEGKLTEEWRAKYPAKEPASALLARILRERREKWEADQLAKFAAAGKEPPKNWRDKYKEPVQPETSQLPALPNEWTWATVEQVSTKVVDGVHKKPSYVEDGVPFVTVRNLTAGPRISFENLKYVTLADHQEFIKRANPEMGDVLVTKDGTLGVTRAIRTNRPFSIFVSVALVKPVQRESFNYLEIAFLSPTVQQQMVGKGSGLQHIHLEDLRQDCLPLPPVLEQLQIVTVVSEKLSQIDDAEKRIEHGLLRAARLRQSILKQAFEGKLVPQDPSDEPASVLLERLRAQQSIKGENRKAGNSIRTFGRGAKSKKIERRVAE